MGFFFLISHFLRFSSALQVCGWVGLPHLHRRPWRCTLSLLFCKVLATENAIKETRKLTQNPSVLFSTLCLLLGRIELINQELDVRIGWSYSVILYTAIKKIMTDSNMDVDFKAHTMAY